MKIERYTSRGLIVRNNKVVLIHRIKKGNEYWVVPGGGIEDNESEEEALNREIKEELGIKIEIIRKITTIQRKIQNTLLTESFFECRFISGTLGSGDGIEFTERMNNDNVYIIEEVDAEQVDSLNIFPSEIKDFIKQILCNQ